MLIVIILLGTIGMTIYFHVSSRKKWTPHLLVGSLVIMFTLSMPLLLNLRSEHEAEIEKVIASREGTILDIEAIMSNEYPMRRGKANTIYKVTYLNENNQTNTAWYRGINHIGNIHETVSGSFPNSGTSRRTALIPRCRQLSPSMS